MPELIVTESSYEFISPHTGNFWPKVLGIAAARLIKRKHKICNVEVRGADKIAELLKQQHGLLLAPNHCRMSDALVLQQLSRKLSQPFYVMASSHFVSRQRLYEMGSATIGGFQCLSRRC